MTDANTLRADSWLRAQGLPTLVPVPRWGVDLARRTAPLVVFITVFRPALTVVAWLYRRSPGGLFDLADIAIFVAFAIAFIAIPALAARWVRRWLDRLPQGPARVGSWLMMLVCLVVLSLNTEIENFDHTWRWDVFNGVLVIAAAFALVWIGGGSLLGWALRSTVHKFAAVRSMASIALPVILGLVIFSFFSADTWQLTDSLSWPRIFSVGLLMAATATAVILPACQSAVRAARDDLTPGDRRELIAATPLDESAQPEVTVAQPLSRAQAANVLLVMITTQLLLGVIFAALQTALLLVLGKVSLTDAALKTWLGHSPIRIVVADTTLPVTVSMLKAATFLAMISALTFLISAVNDESYRRLFFDPIILDVRRAMAVHDLAATQSPRGSGEAEAASGDR